MYDRVSGNALEALTEEVVESHSRSLCRSISRYSDMQTPPSKPRHSLPHAPPTTDEPWQPYRLDGGA